MNKKVKNATSTQYNNIIFKSKLEATCYRLLLEAGFTPLYEQYKATLLPKFFLGRGYAFIPNNKTKIISPIVNIRSMTYTPDFTFYLGE